MGKLGTYQPPTEKYKNYSLPTSKPARSHSFYQEKVWTLQEQIYKKLKKVSEFLEHLYPKLKSDFSLHEKAVIGRNLEKLNKDLDLMKKNLHKNPYAFNTDKLKINQYCIDEMKSVCDNLRNVKSYEHEFKNLNKMKHVLNELEHLIQPTNFERELEKGRVKEKPIIAPAKKETVLIKAQGEAKEKIISPKKPKATSKKAKPTVKLRKSIKTDKPLRKSKAPKSKLKAAVKKTSKPKTKSLVKPKKSLTLKSKPKIKSSAASKKRSTKAKH